MVVVQEVVLPYLVLIATLVVEEVLVHIEKDLLQFQHHKQLQSQLVQVVQRGSSIQQQDHHHLLDHQ